MARKLAGKLADNPALNRGNRPKPEKDDKETKLPGCVLSEVAVDELESLRSVLQARGSKISRKICDEINFPLISESQHENESGAKKAI